MSKHSVWVSVALMVSGLCHAAYYAAMRDFAGVGLGVWFLWAGSGRFWPSARILWWFAGWFAGVGGIVAWVATRSGGA